MESRVYILLAVPNRTIYQLKIFAGPDCRANRIDSYLARRAKIETELRFVKELDFGDEIIRLIKSKEPYSLKKVLEDLQNFITQDLQMTVVYPRSPAQFRKKIRDWVDYSRKKRGDPKPQIPLLPTTLLQTEWNKLELLGISQRKQKLKQIQKMNNLFSGYSRNKNDGIFDFQKIDSAQTKPSKLLALKLQFDNQIENQSIKVFSRNPEVLINTLGH